MSKSFNKDLFFCDQSYKVHNSKELNLILDGDSEDYFIHDTESDDISRYNFGKEVRLTKEEVEELEEEI